MQEKVQARHLSLDERIGEIVSRVRAMLLPFGVRVDVRHGTDRFMTIIGMRLRYNRNQEYGMTHALSEREMVDFGGDEGYREYTAKRIASRFCMDLIEFQAKVWMPDAPFIVIDEVIAKASMESPDGKMFEVIPAEFAGDPLIVARK